ncbi:rab escort protein 1 [Nymphaea colorata]|nr:rab escort protein 1 [Nymphaea colorata]
MASEFPDIEPSQFDLIVVGTGLPESILAAAASVAGKSVLHLDPAPFYGSHYASLPIDDFTSFLNSHQETSSTLNESPSADEESAFLTVGLQKRPLYSSVEISSGDIGSLGRPRSFNLDLSGPRLLFCADSMVDMILRSSASHHLEFKSVEANCIWVGGELKPVPDSRAAIFQDRSLGLMVKNRLMNFFKLVRGHFDSEGGERISDEDMEKPFVQFLTEQGLPDNVKCIILYAIAMVDYDQDNAEAQNLIKTKDGIENLALYNASSGRFSNTVGSFIYPLYGQGELPQSFCRCAAVKGAIYILRMPVMEIICDKESRHYKGIKIASGQKLLSNHLVLDPSFTDPASAFNSPSYGQNNENQRSYVEVVDGVQCIKQKVARAVCVTSKSLQSDLSNVLLVIPPKSLYPEQQVCIRALQLGSNLSVCPPDLFIVYISMLCDEARQGKNAISAAMNALFMLPVSESAENDTSLQSESSESKEKPKLLWHAIHVQELTQHKLTEGIVSCPMPDGKLDYRDILQSTRELFQKMYPDDEFFPEVAATENVEDD